MAKADYYEVLGVARSVDNVELKRAYRELAMRWHPDKNPDDRAAEEKFKQVSEAYAVLSDPDKRARYDRTGHAGDLGFDFGVSTFTDLFESLFGDLFGKKKGKAVGRDLRYTVELDFVEAALGVDKTITFPSQRECGECQGTGADGGASGQAPCGACAGRGEIKVQQGFFSLGKPCTTCHGSGKVASVACAACKGAGLVAEERSYTVAIPPGMEDGSTRTVKGQGEPGRRGGAAGDLHVTVKVRPHPLFKREGQVIVCEVPLSFTQAALGDAIDVPTLDGNVALRVPPGTQSGQIFRLRGRGMPLGLKGSPRGEAHVRVVVETPTQLGTKERQLLEELARSLGPASLPLRARYEQKVKETAPK